MSKKHFIALADAIREHNIREENRRMFHNTLFEGPHLETLATVLEDEYPRFNRQRWIAYIKGECGPNGGKVKAN